MVGLMEFFVQLAIVLGFCTRPLALFKNVSIVGALLLSCVAGRPGIFDRSAANLPDCSR